jgi:glycosyltransferase involved in cell wall biosynthesis
MVTRWVGKSAGDLVGKAVLGQIRRTCSRADLVMGVSDSVLKPYEGACAERMVVRSFAPSWFADAPAADVCGPSRDRFTLMHGKSNLQRGTAVVLEAARLAKIEVDDLRIVMLSNFLPVETFTRADFAARVNALGLEAQVDLRDGVPMEAMPGILRQCDVGLISYGRALGEDSLPNRLFEYMAAGLAIIAPGYAKEIARIVRTERCGMLVDFEKPDAIAEAIVWLRTHPAECRGMGARARQAFLEKYNWEVEFRPVLERIAAWHSQRPGAGETK